MEALLRVGVAAINGGEPAVAGRLWAALDAVPPELATGAPGGAVTVGEHVVAVDDAGATVDGVAVTVETLGLDELVTGVQALAAGSGAASDRLDGLGDLAADLDGAVERTRVRLLLEDVLLDPAGRPVALDRLGQLVGRHRRRRRDVEGVFDG